MTDMDDEAMKMARRKQAARNDAAEYLRRIGHITGAEADAILRGKWDCRAEVTWFLDQHAIRSGQQFRKGVGIHNERKVILQNKRVNDAIQTALERGELTVSSDGYLAALTPSALSVPVGDDLAKGLRTSQKALDEIARQEQANIAGYLALRDFPVGSASGHFPPDEVGPNALGSDIPSIAAQLLEISRISNKYDLRECIEGHDDALGDSYIWRDLMDQCEKLGTNPSALSPGQKIIEGLSEALDHAKASSVLSGDAGEGDEHYTVAMERRPKEIGGVKVGPGLYRIHWKSGGSSLAAIGMCRNGAWWVAPTNWVEPAVAFRVDEDPEGRWSWACVDALERLEPASLPSHQGAGE